MIYAIVGASGSGKSTISEAFDGFNVSRIISHTTRRKRIGERDDEYYFKTLNEFDEIDFIERVEYSGNHYGISKSEVDEKVSNGDCYVIVDRLGVEQLKKIYDNVVVIFIYAPIKDLIHNMEKRGDNKQNILARVNNANNTGELDNFDIADYIIYNNSTIENAKGILRNILKPTIYIDIDNTVHNSTRRFVEVYNEIHNSNKDWTKVTDWSFKPELDVSYNEILNIFETDDFYKGDNLYPSLIQAISTLKEWGCNIKFVTRN